jgi:hypothetical protein
MMLPARIQIPTFASKAMIAGMEDLTGFIVKRVLSAHRK